MFLLSNALVICWEQIAKTEHISSDVLQMSIRENRIRAQRGVHEEERKRRESARKKETEIVVHAYDRRDWSGDRSNANRSFENRSAATGGSDLGAMAVDER